MKTYIIVWFTSDGARPTEVVDRLLGMGFKPATGAYDFVYDWRRNTNVEEVLRIGDKIHEALNGMNVLFKLETV